MRKDNMGKTPSEERALLIDSSGRSNGVTPIEHSRYDIHTVTVYD
jgi:hypothetical protein